MCKNCSIIPVANQTVIMYRNKEVVGTPAPSSLQSGASAPHEPSPVSGHVPVEQANLSADNQVPGEVAALKYMQPYQRDKTSPVERQRLLGIKP